VKLNFLIQAQLDISFTLNMVNKFSKKLQTFHLDAMKHFFKYIKGIIDSRICYCHGEVSVLEGSQMLIGPKTFKIENQPLVTYLFLGLVL